MQVFRRQKEHVTRKWEEIKKTTVLCATLVLVCKLVGGEFN